MYDYYSIFWYWQKCQCKNFTRNWMFLFMLKIFFVFFFCCFICVWGAGGDGELQTKLFALKIYNNSLSRSLLEYVWIGFGVVVGFANGMDKMKFTQFLSVYRSWLNRNKIFSVNAKVASKCYEDNFWLLFIFFFSSSFCYLKCLAVLEIMPFVGYRCFDAYGWIQTILFKCIRCENNQIENSKIHPKWMESMNWMRVKSTYSLFHYSLCGMEINFLN